MGRDLESHKDHGLALEEARPEVKLPPMYRVVLLNDDYTPMEFVVDILESVFGMERTRATQVMLEVHTKGKGICGVYNYEIAHFDGERHYIHGLGKNQAFLKKVLKANDFSMLQRIPPENYGTRHFPGLKAYLNQHPVKKIKRG